MPGQSKKNLPRLAANQSTRNIVAISQSQIMFCVFVNLTAIFDISQWVFKIKLIGQKNPQSFFFGKNLFSKTNMMNVILTFTGNTEKNVI